MATNDNTAPHDQPIDVLTIEEGMWLRVRWNDADHWFDVVDGDGSWVLPAEIDAWREAPHPSIGIGTPKERRDP